MRREEDKLKRTSVHPPHLSIWTKPHARSSLAEKLWGLKPCLAPHNIPTSVKKRTTCRYFPPTKAELTYVKAAKRSWNKRKTRQLGIILLPDEMNQRKTVFPGLWGKTSIGKQLTLEKHRLPTLWAQDFLLGFSVAIVLGVIRLCVNTIAHLLLQRD